MSEKTMGRVAFEAYCEAVGGVAYDGKPIPGWWELSGDTKTVQDGWEAAALAVAKAHDAQIAMKPGVDMTDFRGRQQSRWVPALGPNVDAPVRSTPDGVEAPYGDGGAPTGAPVPVESGPDEG